MGFTPEHLLRSLESLRKICLSAISGNNLIDDRELHSLSTSTLNAVQIYNQQFAISELTQLSNSWPQTRSFERYTIFDKSAQLVYYIILGPIIFVLIYSPLISLPLAAFWTAIYGIILLFRRRRRRAIQSEMKRIAELCGAIAMIIRNNESFQ